MSESTLLTLPVVCTRGMIVFPGNRLSLDVGRPLSLKALELSSRDFDNNILFVSQINPIVDDPKYDDVYHVGTLCKIEKKSVAIVQGQSIKLLLEKKELLFEILKLKMVQFFNS